MASTVVVKGLQELSRQFDRVVKEVDGGCKKFMRRVVKQVSDNARAAAPVDSGEYRKSIKWTMAKNGLYGWAYAGKKGDSKRNSKRGYLGHLLEFGTVKMAAIPHFFPALNKAKTEFEPGLKAVIAAVKGGRV